MTERPVNIPPEFTNMGNAHYSDGGGHKARSDAQKDKKAFNKAFPDHETKTTAINYMLGVEGRTADYTNAFERGLDFSSTASEKQKRQKFLKNRLNRLSKYILGRIEHESDEVQEVGMEIHSIVEAMKPKKKERKG